MKKILVLATAAIISVTGMTAFAQSDNSKQCAKTEQCQQKDCKGQKGDKAQRDGKGPKGQKVAKGMKAGKGKASLNKFEGVNLTDEQVVLIEQLNQKTAAADSARRVQAKEQKAGDREQAMKARQQAKRDYLNNVKSILTPDQYVVYLENIVVETPSQQGGRPGMQAMKGQRPSKDMKANGKALGQRGDKAQKAVKGDKAQKAQKAVKAVKAQQTQAN